MAQPLYIINAQLAELLERMTDTETGALTDDENLWEQIGYLQMARDDAIEQLAMDVKSREAEAEMLRTKARELTKRAGKLETSAESIKERLAQELNGEKFKKGIISINWRKIRKGEYVNEAKFFDWAENGHEIYLRRKAPEINKDQVNEALKRGVEIPGVVLKEFNSMSIRG